MIILVDNNRLIFMFWDQTFVEFIHKQYNLPACRRYQEWKFDPNLDDMFNRKTQSICIHSFVCYIWNLQNTDSAYYVLLVLF